MRNLASIKKIIDLTPIENRDRIELATVDGWSVIVKKDEFKINDLCIFCEIDSLLPQKEEFEFLRSKKFRIKTMKMAGVVSQGICFPLSILPKNIYSLNQDVTDIIGVTKYEKYKESDEEKQNSPTKYKSPIFKFLFRYKIFRKIFLKKGKQQKGFPEFIVKTDETRIQNRPDLLNYDYKYIAREKIDGSSVTIFRSKIKRKFRKPLYDFGVCSRNLRIWSNSNSNNFWNVVDKYQLKEKIELIQQKYFPDSNNIVFQGEVIAPDIQGNKYKVKEPDLYLFNLIVNGKKINCITAKS